MKVLITGGAGFVGRHVAARYAKLGYDVTIVDNLYPGSGGKHPSEWMPHLKVDLSRVKFIKDDCRDYFSCQPSNREKFDAIVHLAAVVGGRLVIENDPLAVAIDLSIDSEFFYWLSRLDYRPERIHYFSSSAAYPVAFQRPESHQLLKEEMIAFNGEFIGQADLTYGWAKLTGEYLASLTHKKHGHHITCYRPFSGYGEDQDMAYPFPSILARVLRGDQPITVWGSGRQMRDFIYIEDCIDGMLKIGETLGDGGGVNLSTGVPTSFNELARMAWSAVNDSDSEFRVKNTTSKPEGVFARYGSTEMQERLGFRYSTSLEAGISRCLRFWKDYGQL